MLRQILARGLAADVVDATPALAAVRIDMQSAFIRGGVGHILSTQSIAHSSAAAAVALRVGGVPLPYPSSLPLAATTTMPEPVLRRAAHLPHSRLPSVYHVALSV